LELAVGGVSYRPLLPEPTVICSSGQHADGASWMSVHGGVQWSARETDTLDVPSFRLNWIPKYRTSSPLPGEAAEDDEADGESLPERERELRELLELWPPDVLELWPPELESRSDDMENRRPLLLPLPLPLPLPPPPPLFPLPPLPLLLESGTLPRRPWTVIRNRR